MKYFGLGLSKLINLIYLDLTLYFIIIYKNIF